MHDTLQKEIALYEKRTPKSAEAHKKAQKRIPLGVGSNYRAYDPYPISWRKGTAARSKTSTATNILTTTCVSAR